MTNCTGIKNDKPKNISTNTEKPNIIYILADDLGYGDLRSLNPDSRIPTPNMDKIVREGVHFTDAHSSSAVCTPTRYGILTGRYAFRTRLKNGVLWGYSTSLIEPGRTTVASFLKEKGYQTACIGKWHLGLDWSKKDSTKAIPDVQGGDQIPSNFDDNVDYIKPVKGDPSDHGFDNSLIIPASLDMYPYCYIRNGIVVEAPTFYTEGKNQDVDGRGVFWRAGKMSPSFDFFKVLPTFVDSACAYISSAGKHNKPFFLYLSLPAPHTPWLPTLEFKGRSSAGKYGDYVAMVDEMLGKVLETVKNANIDDNTLVIVTSDNGSDWGPSDIEETGHRANYHFKGQKADIYEAGHRIPFVARWKGIIPAGLASEEVMCTTDLMGTLAGMLHQTVPEGAGEDSYNLWPAFVGEVSYSPIREATIHHSLDGFFSIRKGKWKLTPYLGSGGFTIPKVIKPQKGEAPGTLYDMGKDPQEQVNLYSQYPDIVQKLSELLELYKSQGYSIPPKKTLTH
ncbi:MAG: arylsulfatase [Bacteroidales bacterium]